MTAEVIPDAHKPAGKLDPVIEKLTEVLGLLESRTEELEKHVEAGGILIDHISAKANSPL
jgi:hypothetical protein